MIDDNQHPKVNPLKTILRILFMGAEGAAGDGQTGGGDGQGASSQTGDGAAASGDGQGDTQSKVKQGDGQAQANWYDSLPKEVHDVAKQHADASAFVKSLTEAKQSTSKPDKPGGYRIEYEQGVEIPAGQVRAAQEKYKQYAVLAHNLGLTQEQFTKMISADAKREIARAKSLDEQVQKTESELRDSWGNEYDTKLDKAEKVVQRLFDDKFRNFLVTSGLARNAEFIRSMYNLSETISEDSFIKSEKRTKKPNRDPLTGLPMLDYKM